LSSLVVSSSSSLPPPHPGTLQQRIRHCYDNRFSISHPVSRRPVCPPSISLCLCTRTVRLSVALGHDCELCGNAGTDRDAACAVYIASAVGFLSAVCDSTRVVHGLTHGLRWVGLTRGLDWIAIFHFLTGWVMFTIAKVQKNSKKITLMH